MSLKTKKQIMKFCVYFLAGIGIGTLAGVIGLMYPFWNNFAWWMGVTLATALYIEGGF